MNNTMEDGTVTGIKISVYDMLLTFNTVSDIVMKKDMDTIMFHMMLGHCGSDRLEKNAKLHNFGLSGEFKTCEECAIAKSHAKECKQGVQGVSQIPGERLYLDISSVRDEWYGGSKFCILIVDDCGLSSSRAKVS
jgi:hypothetical protein